MSFVSCPSHVRASSNVPDQSLPQEYARDTAMEHRITTPLNGTPLSMKAESCGSESRNSLSKVLGNFPGTPTTL
jgi:hypothetical protein